MPARPPLPASPLAGGRSTRGLPLAGGHRRPPPGRGEGYLSGPPDGNAVEGCASGLSRTSSRAKRGGFVEMIPRGCRRLAGDPLTHFPPLFRVETACTPPPCPGGRLGGGWIAFLRLGEGRSRRGARHRSPDRPPTQTAGCCARRRVPTGCVANARPAPLPASPLAGGRSTSGLSLAGGGVLSGPPDRNDVEAARQDYRERLRGRREAGRRR